jgi:hypothetical protein
MTDTPPDDQPKNELDFVATWLDAIELSTDEEKDWVATAERACEAYRGGSSASSITVGGSNLSTFNIFHSNIETLVPALYNSTPIPDVRRRFNDDDPVGKEVSEIYERSISYQIDTYDLDCTILAAVRDMAITSRGLVRVRYEPSFGRDGTVAYEQTRCEYVPWKTFRRGPGRTWEEVPWIAFELYLSYSEVEKLLADEPQRAAILKAMKFSYSAEPKKTPEQQADNLSKLAARARVWEVWDKDARKVHFIAPDYTLRRLTSLDDPLELREFYPIPRPLAALVAPDSLVPITLLQVYEKLLEELNEVQRRIIKLTKQLRPRGGYAGLSEDIKAITEADDGELVALSSAEMFATTGGGIEKAITWFPLEATTKALEQLVVQREFIKKTIWEVTGLADIMRGDTDPNETLGAQQLKSQWGGLRIQRMQADVARFARDLFRLKAEIMARKFSFETFIMMTSLRYPTQQEKAVIQQQMQAAQAMGQQMQLPPQQQEMMDKPIREEVEQLLKDINNFRIDIESDSTIRGDVQRNQEQMALFLQGTAQYLSAVGPLVQEGAMPQEIAVEIFAAFCRSFRLGKQAEDALDKMADQAKQAAEQPKQPSPEEIKVQGEQQKMQMELQLKQQEHAMKLELMKAEMAQKQQELAFKEQELNLKAREMQMKIEMGQQEMQMDAQLGQQKMAIEQQSNEMDLAARQREAMLGMEAAEHKHELGIEMMDHKAKQAKQRPQPRAR